MTATTSPTPIRAAIVGYGNLGRSVHNVIESQPDIELYGIFSRRENLDTGTDAAVYNVTDIAEHQGKIDVLYLCLGSATDIPEQAPALAELFTTVDTYDNHRDIPRHRDAMQAAAKVNNHVAVVSTGWDPGMFSLNRVYAQAILPQFEQHTFWGPGLSQGHSDALRRIPGVKSAVQYTLPNEKALDLARNGQAGDLTGKQAHLRQCWVVADDANHEAIENAIRTMPDYFVGYEVEVHFIDQATFDRDHAGMPHGGHVITFGQIGDTSHTIEYSLKLDSNPNFTAAVQVAYGRAAHRLAQEEKFGAYTVLEVAPYLLSPKPLEELIADNV